MDSIKDWPELQLDDHDVKIIKDLGRYLWENIIKDRKIHNEAFSKFIMSLWYMLEELAKDKNLYEYSTFRDFGIMVPIETELE